MKKETWITIGICSFFLLIAGFLYLHSASEKKPMSKRQWNTSEMTVSSASSSEDIEGAGGMEDSGECTVYICGAVKHPGVYSFPIGARVCDAVKAAGGLKKKALSDAVNQARKIMDGEQITIPFKTTKRSLTSSEHSELVNINQAGAQELMTLTGIGESKAQMIIDYREENGPFTCIEDIMKISGIKEGVYNQIKENITV